MLEKVDASPKKPLQQPLVLLVEDDYDQRALFKMFFERLNMTVVPVENAEAAKEILGEIHFDLVICDINMPNIDGTELITQLRQAGDQETLPVLCFTADPHHHEDEVLRCGANAFCLKTERSRLARTATELVTGAGAQSLLPEVCRRFHQSM